MRLVVKSDTITLMKPRFAEKNEIDNWNNLIVNNPDGGNVFSSYEFAMQKLTGGYKVKFIIINDIAVTVLEKNALFLGKLWYLPKGPGVNSADELINIINSLKEFAKTQAVFAIRIESELLKNEQPKLEGGGFIKSRPIIPNPSTITLDISDDEKKILENLPQKGRYAINRAKRDGVTIELVKSNDENCKIMYKLLSETAEGQFGIRSYEYYKSFWQRFESAGYGQLFFAKYDNNVVAGAYAMVYGKKSTYKDGASIRKRVVYGASHLLQWEVIKWAKSKGANLHDLCGSPPSEDINNVNHKHYGIGLFKTAFSKHIVDYIGCYDLPINKNRYNIWINLGEKIAIRLHYYKHHDSYF